MNVSYWIGKRLMGKREASFTKVILRIAIGAIALSLGVMLLTSLMIQGFKKEITSKVIGFWGHIHITDGGLTSTMEQQKPISFRPDYLEDLKSLTEVSYTEDDSYLSNQTLRSYGGIDHVQSFTFLPGIIATKSDFGGVILKGIGEDFDWSRMVPYIKEGAILSKDPKEGNQILISSTIARTMKIDTGQRIRLSFIKERDQIKRVFTVQGIYNTGLEEFDKQFAVVHLANIRDVLDWAPDQVGGFEVFLEDSRDMELMSDYIYYELLPPNQLAQPITTKLRGIFDWLELQDINMQTILLLMVIVAIINMTTSLLILILDRTKMIGILKALGSDDWQIRKVFLHMAGYIMLLGMAFGNLLGLGLGWLQKTTSFIKLDEASYYLTEAPIHFDFWQILWINGGTFLITLAFLVIPTWIIVKIQPVKVLAFD